MPKTPNKRLINPDELFGCRDLGMHDRRESQYPQLMRLCADFNFSVLQLQRKIFSHLTRKMAPGPFEFVLATYDETACYWYSVTPSVSNLKLLNDYVKQHEIDILHMQLFGEDEETQHQVTENSFY